MDHFLKKIKEKLPKDRRIFLVSDQKVFTLYGQRVVELLGCSDYILIPEGEACKTRHVKDYVEDRLFALRVLRCEALIALGGGALSDLTGFVAATYMRGIDYYCIPTTLLAMVDACIGGKCAINHPLGKNLIGAFHKPKDVFNSPLFLKSLPIQRTNDAMAEIIKYGIIADKSIFEMLSAPMDLLIKRCQSIKNAIVSKDLRDKGIRLSLNFGHTIGHAVESLSNFRLSHGQAISIGICAELELSHRLCSFPMQSLNFVKGLLESYCLPVTIDGFIVDDILEKCLQDKKSGFDPNFVLIRELGVCESFGGRYLKAVNTNEIREVLCTQ